MSRIKDFYNKYLSRINAYWLVIIGFLILTFTVGDSNLYKRYTYDEKIRSLEREIKHYQKEIEINSKKLNDLRTDKEGLERFAREEYHQKEIMNQKARTIIFSMAGLLILAGAVLFLTKWFLAPYLFAVGAAGMAVCFLTLPTKDMEFRERRLHRFNIIASVLMICASGLMFKDMKEWIICLTIAAVLLLYSSFVSGKQQK